jgi:hypothetical protein
MGPLRAPTIDKLRLTNESDLETMWLLCDRRATPSDRGQWGSALPATPRPLYG